MDHDEQQLVVGKRLGQRLLEGKELRNTQVAPVGEVPALLHGRSLLVGRSRPYRVNGMAKTQAEAGKKGSEAGQPPASRGPDGKRERPKPKPVDLLDVEALLTDEE